MSPDAGGRPAGSSYLFKIRNFHPDGMFSFVLSRYEVESLKEALGQQALVVRMGRLMKLISNERTPPTRIVPQG